MLPRAVRMRSGDEFTRAVRRGARVGTATLVVHGWRDPAAGGGAPLVGFVVSKAVGTAVVRNRVKRRLRHLVRDRIDAGPADARVVVRALPAAATRPARLSADLDFAWRKLTSRWGEWQPWNSTEVPTTGPELGSGWQPGCRDRAGRAGIDNGLARR